MDSEILTHMSTDAPAPVYDILDRLRRSSTSQYDKGERFERFVQGFLHQDPEWAMQFNHVWLWKDWPGRKGRDTGIDLVAERKDGQLTAIQAKFYEPDHTVSKADLDSFLAESGKLGFVDRLWVSTSVKWGYNAERTVQDQTIPFRRLGLSDLEQSKVDWDYLDPDRPDEIPLKRNSTLRSYQREAIDRVTRGFRDEDRGRMIMACGTGKTFTSLRLAEQYVGDGGSVLFLVPSIALLSQALREWSHNTEVGITATAVCSDREVSRIKHASEDSPTISVVDLALPATTDPLKLAEQLKAARSEGEGMRVVFATYQSIDVVARAQKSAGLDPFDLIICDEAHRTTGVTLADSSESAFVRVHDQEYLKAAKRLYMTATPRIYSEGSQKKAENAGAAIASMDNETVYGPELYRLSFGEAVSMGMLTDYKVLILTVNEDAVSEAMQETLTQDGELSLDDATRLVGCWNGLAKRGDLEHDFGQDAQPMKRAVAFARSIKDSKKVRDQFSEVVSGYESAQGGDVKDMLNVQLQHVDGTMGADERNDSLDWLRAETDNGVCRVLTNARCLSEGVDVPSLDAVMFLNPRKSVVDVVQSVGRVMRKSPGKRYGYIILPVVIPAGQSAESALDSNKSFQVVWEVLQALRAHDERFDAMVNKVELTKDRDDKINVIGVPPFGRDEHDDDGSGAPSSDKDSAQAVQAQLQLKFERMEELRDAIYARMVKKVGTRHYWEQWAQDIAQIAQRHITRITSAVQAEGSEAAGQFEVFLDALRRNLNESISWEGAIEMLAQHMITKPVFDALFEGYEFTISNPVSQVMDRMVRALQTVNVDVEAESLERFYASVRLRAQGIDTAEGKQKIITELYENFFKAAFAKTADAMGVVYTPVEIVDFILRSVDDVLTAEFGVSISNEGVHVLDPFTGTGTFIVRLLQSGLIRPEDLARKYAHELHANEILLLAYYIAAINIETTFHDLQARSHETGLEKQGYEPFSGIVLTDTFQLTENDDLQDEMVFPVNNTRAEAQKKLDIRVIVGNPPYSVGQSSGNDDNVNVKYPILDARIEDTYVRRATGGNARNLYDSYMRAIRWASDRIGEEGVIGFVTNGGWIDGNTAAGVRKTLAEEFSSIYVFNLRGNQRTAGEQSRKEGGKVFGAGSRNTVAIFLLVKHREHQGDAHVQYRDIGDYLSAPEKLTIVRNSHIKDVPWQTLTPNRHGDWINQRDEDYLKYPPLAEKRKVDSTVTAFALSTNGVNSARDAWAFNSSKAALEYNIERSTSFLNRQIVELGGDSKHADRDATKHSWNRSDWARVKTRAQVAYEPKSIREALYRPFSPQNVYASPAYFNMFYRMIQVYPTARHENYGFYLTGPSSAHDFSALGTRNIPDLHLLSTGQFFPRYRWEPVKDGALSLDLNGETLDGYRRVDNITDEFHRILRERYGSQITKDDIFFFLYGLLHSPEYRERYAGELKQMLPRIPEVPVSAFQLFVQAGGELFHLHADYEDVEPLHLPIRGGDQPPLGGESEYYRVEKMRLPKGEKAADEPTELIVNHRITLTGLPAELFRYQLGSRSVVEWLIRQYQVSTDKASGIVNDPNDWGLEHGNPRYIIDLIEKVAAVAVRTVEITNSLPSISEKADG